MDDDLKKLYEAVIYLAETTADGLRELDRHSTAYIIDGLVYDLKTELFNRT